MSDSTFDKRLAKANKLAKEIDEWCNAIHPSGGDSPTSGIPQKMEHWKKMVKNLWN